MAFVTTWFFCEDNFHIRNWECHHVTQNIIRHTSVSHIAVIFSDLWYVTVNQGFLVCFFNISSK